MPIDDAFWERKDKLMEYESYLLRALAFDVEVELPHRFLFNYVHSLRHYCCDALPPPPAPALVPAAGPTGQAAGPAGYSEQQLVQLQVRCCCCCCCCCCVLSLGVAQSYARMA